MTTPIAWQKSSFSGTHGDCVELAALGGAIAIRESDDPRRVVTTTPAELGAFLHRAKEGEFDTITQEM